MDHKTLMVLSVLMATLQIGKSTQNLRKKRANVPFNSLAANAMDSNQLRLSSNVVGLLSILNSCERERDLLKGIIGTSQKNGEENVLKLKDLINACEQERNRENVQDEQSVRRLTLQLQLLFDYMVARERGTPYPGVAKYTKYIVARFGMSELPHVQPLKPGFGPVINDVLSIRYPINIPKCVEVTIGFDMQPSLFIAVISATENHAKRNIIRNTWKNHLVYVRDKRRFHFIHFGFFLGNPNDVAAQRLIENESNVYRDIIQIDMLDTYRNLTLKMAGVLNWIYGNCQRVNFVFKVDDDAYVNVHNLAYFVELHRHDLSVFGRAPRIEPGRNDNNWGPMRDGKHGITLDAWPWTTFPNYIQGNAYVIHGDLIVPLLAAYQTTPMIPFEDVFLTGIATEKAGIRKRFSLGLPSILANYNVWDVCDAHNYIAWIGQFIHRDVDNFYRGVSQCFTTNSFWWRTRVDYSNPLQFKFYV